MTRFETVVRRRLPRRLLVRCERAILVAGGAVVIAAAATSTSFAQFAEAFVGEPFGVARVTLPIDMGAGVFDTTDPRLGVVDADGRVLYPVAGDAPARRLLRRVLDINTPASTTIYFLFRGDGPLTVTAYSPSATKLTIQPVRDPGAWSRMMNTWWENYAKHWQQLDQDPQFPPIVENYLTASLARRLGFPQPEPKSGLLALGSSAKPTAVDELLATERHLLGIDRELLAGNPAESGRADQPLPPPMPWYDLDPPADSQGIAVEPLALHAPAECLYLRFGTFTNYLWFRDFTGLWKNDLGNMILRRSIRRGGTDRVEQQLAIHQTALSKVLGPQVISDVAIILLDPAMDQGAALGMLFHAKNNLLLARDLNGQRQEALKKFADAKETQIEIAGRKASLIATPHGEVRSYYLQDGDFHLVTTSRRLVQRFIEAGQGVGSLAASPGFLHVRQRIPFDADATLFAYAAPELFRELSSPGPWIERRRRLRANRTAKLVELARLNAAAEGSAARTMPDLIAAGYLPAGFGATPDGATLEVADDAPAIDSLRGTAGYFTPTADMEITSASLAESSAYRSFADRFNQQCGQFPPIAVAVRRAPRAGGDVNAPAAAGDETITIEALAAPLDRVKLGKLLDVLGEPSTKRVAWLPGDLINVEAVVDAILPLGGNTSGQHQIFLGVRDFSAELELARGRLGLPVPDQRQAMKVYWGSWPKAGILGLLSDFAGAAQEPQPDEVNGLVMARRDDIFLGGFSPTLVREVLPQLVVEEVAEPAQAWLHIEQIAGTALESVVNKLGYSRVLASSTANGRLLGALAAQLHVPAEQCRSVAERLMDGELACPLGGEYQLVAPQGQMPHWASTVVAPANHFFLSDPPADFQLPIVGWFEGCNADALVGDDLIRIRAELAVDRSALPQAFQWPALPAKTPAAGDRAVEPPANPEAPTTAEEIVPPPASK